MHDWLMGKQKSIFTASYSIAYGFVYEDGMFIYLASYETSYN